MTSSEAPSASEAKKKEPTQAQLKSLIRHTDRDLSQAGTPAAKHEVDFQACFPGWPKGYFMGILPVTSLGAATRAMGYPGYNYTSMENAVVDTPFPGTVFKPTTPDPMYVACMPWCAYPYGVPAAGREQPVYQHHYENFRGATPRQEVHKDESVFLAVPTPPSSRSKTGVINYFGQP